MQLIVLFLALIPLALAQCANNSVPLDPAVVGQSDFTSGGCSPGGATFSQSVRIEPWGVLYQPLFGHPFLGGPACPEHIVVLFSKSDKPAVILHRPQVDTMYFATAAPAVYKAFLKDSNTVWPCHKVPLQRVMVWGAGRKKFVALVGKAIKGIERIRDFDCNEIRGGPPGRPLSKPEVDKLLRRHRLTNAAINYLYGLSYSNFFCVA